MNVLLALVVGVFAVRLFVVACRGLIDTAALHRPNYRGRRVTTAAGIYAVLAVVVVEAGRSLLGAFDIGDEPGDDRARLLIMLACVGFGLIGLVDDLLGSDDRGFRGHLKALGEGRVTTGTLKIVGVSALALVIVGTGGGASRAGFLADAALIALAANLANLLDRAPGRAIKVSLIAYIPIAIVAGRDAVGVAIAPVIGAFVGLLGDDLRERVMLGDTGAYALGGTLGVAAVLELGRGPRNAVLAVLIALTVLAEFASLSALIQRVPPLRWFDALGRNPA